MYGTFQLPGGTERLLSSAGQRDLKAGCTPTPRELSEGDRGRQQGVLSDQARRRGGRGVALDGWRTVCNRHPGSTEALKHCIPHVQGKPYYPESKVVSLVFCTLASSLLEERVNNLLRDCFLKFMLTACGFTSDTNSLIFTADNQVLAFLEVPAGLQKRRGPGWQLHSGYLLQSFPGNQKAQGLGDSCQV